MQDEEILQIVGKTVARHDAVGRQPHVGAGSVLDVLGDAEHEVLVDRYGAAEDKAVAVVPDEGDGAADPEGFAAFQLPRRVGAGHVVEAQIACWRPAVERIIRLRAAGGGEEAHDRGVVLERFVVFTKRQVIDAPAPKRD